MVIAVDTNVVLSAILFPSGAAADFMREAFSNHTVVLGSFVLNELRAVFERKFPERVPALETFVNTAAFVTVHTEHGGYLSEELEVRDPKDREVVEGALLARADCLVTGDLDILEIEGLTSVERLSPGEFLRKYRGVHQSDDPS